MAADESKHDTADAAVAAAAVPSPAGAGKTEAVPSKSAIAAVAEAANPDLNPDGDTPDAGCFVIVTSAPTQAGPAACSDVEDVIIAPAGTKGFKYILFTVCGWVVVAVVWLAGWLAGCVVLKEAVALLCSPRCR